MTSAALMSEMAESVMNFGYLHVSFIQSTTMGKKKNKKQRTKKTHIEKKKRRMDAVDKYAAQNATLLLKLSPLVKSPVWPLEAAV